MCHLVTKEFLVAGMKNTGLFRDYAELVPQAAQQFLQRADQIEHSTGIEVAVYEPKVDEHHEEGSFYVGMLVSKKMENLPEGMEYLHFNHAYAVIKGKSSEMGSLYSTLDRWVAEQSYQRDTPAHKIIEVYHPGEFEEEVEIHIPVKN